MRDSSGSFIIPINVTDKEEPYFNQSASRLTETAVPGTAVVLSCEVRNLGRYKVCTYLTQLSHHHLYQLGQSTVILVRGIRNRFF